MDQVFELCCISYVKKNCNKLKFRGLEFIFVFSIQSVVEMWMHNQWENISCWRQAEEIKWGRRERNLPTQNSDCSRGTCCREIRNYFWKISNEWLKMKHFEEVSSSISFVILTELCEHSFVFFVHASSKSSSSKIPIFVP